MRLSKCFQEEAPRPEVGWREGISDDHKGLALAKSLQGGLPDRWERMLIKALVQQRRDNDGLHLPYVSRRKLPEPVRRTPIEHNSVPQLPRWLLRERGISPLVRVPQPVDRPVQLQHTGSLVKLVVRMAVIARTIDVLGHARNRQGHLVELETQPESWLPQQMTGVKILVGQLALLHRVPHRGWHRLRADARRGSD